MSPVRKEDVDRALAEKRRVRARRARERSQALREDSRQAWWKPTPKWYTQLVSGLATIAGSWIVTGAFDDVERGMAGTLLATLAATWVKSNEGKGG